MQSVLDAGDKLKKNVKNILVLLKRLKILCAGGDRKQTKLLY